MHRLPAAVAIAFAVAMLLYFPDRDDGSGAVLGGLSALISVALVLPALARIRPLPARSAGEHVRLAVLSLGLGAALGIANLTVNRGMAALDSTIDQQMVTRWAEFSAWSIVIAGPIIEEIAYRLVLLTGLAWLVGRFSTNPRTMFYGALALSSLIFGVAHIFYGGVDNSLYAGGMALKSSGAGLLLGWVFWRWGLLYSALCHCAANGIHLLLILLVF